MINYIVLKTEIYDLLAAVGTTYEVDRVPDKTPFPNMVYDLRASTEGDTDNTEQVKFVLQITILDHKQNRDTTAIETLLQEVDAAMHKAFVRGDGYYIKILRESIISSLPTADEYTLRRELNYNVNSFSEEA